MSATGYGDDKRMGIILLKISLGHKISQPIVPKIKLGAKPTIS